MPKRQQPSSVPTLPPIAKMREMKAICNPSSSTSSTTQRGSMSQTGSNSLVVHRRVGETQPRRQSQEQPTREESTAITDNEEKRMQALDEPASIESVLEFRETMTNGEKNSSPLAKVASPTGDVSNSVNNSSSSGIGGSSSNGGACQGQTTKFLQPKSMTRAKQWSPQVENLFRLQEAGYRDINEYLAAGHPMPEAWSSNNFIKCLKSKKTGYFLYFRQTRECVDKYLNKIKIYTY